jgi:hypothetical protein
MGPRKRRGRREGRALTAPMVRVQQKHAAEPQDAADLDAILENCPAGR